MTVTQHQFDPGRVSVVMPCHNSEAFLREAIDSALSQSYPKTEIIVVDDGSSDRSRDIVKGYGNSIFFIEQHHGGAYAARNAGLRAATGEFVAFLDADDYWDRDCLAKLHSALVRHAADVAYCGWQNLGPGAPGTHPYVPPDYFAHDPIVAFLQSCPWPIHAALVRRSALLAVGGFSERRLTSMDYDLWIRLLAHTHKMVRVPEVLAFYRWHDKGQISSLKWRQVLDARRVKRDFVVAQPHLVRHIQRSQLRELMNGFVRRAAYQAYWRRDLTSAQALFRAALCVGTVELRDIKYLLLSLLPARLFHALARRVDRRRH